MRKLITILQLYGNLKVILDINLSNRKLSKNIIYRFSISIFTLGKMLPLAPR